MSKKGDAPVRVSHATPERLRKSDGFVEMSSGAKVGEKKGQHIERLQDWPLARLLKQGDITEEQYGAAEEFYADWYLGGLSPYAKSHSDFNAIRGAFGSRDRLASTEAQAHRRDRYQKALVSINKLSRPYVAGVVLMELSPSNVGLSHGRYKSQKQAHAAAVSHIQHGLRDLVDFYL